MGDEASEKPIDLTVEVGAVIEKLIDKIVALEHRIKDLETLAVSQQLLIAKLGGAIEGHQQALEALTTWPRAGKPSASNQN